MSVGLYNIIAQVMAIPVTQIENDSSPKTIESWDSFRGLVLMDELETNFKVKFTLEEVLSTKNVGDIKKSLLNHGVLFDE